MSEQITTVEELDALPEGEAVVRSRGGLWIRGEGSNWHRPQPQRAGETKVRSSEWLIRCGHLTLVYVSPDADWPGRPDTPAPSDDERFHDIAHGVTEAYTPEGQAIWWRAWAMHPDQRARMEAGMLAAWSGEPTDEVAPSDDEREVVVQILDLAGAQSGECGHEPGDLDECNCDYGCRRILEGYADAILAAGFRRQGLVSVSREQVDRAALDAAHAVRGVAAHLRDADRLHVTAALHSLKITVAD